MNTELLNKGFVNKEGVVYQVPLKNRLARGIMRPIFRFLFHILGRVKIDGLENVPKTPPYIIAMNHVSIFDPPFCLAFWPTCPEAIGAAEIWSKPGQATLARWYGGIPVHRGEYDRLGIEKMLSILQSGYSLVIAPEGGRSHTPGMQRGLPGVAYLVDQARIMNLNCVVIPVGIVGTTDDYFQRAKRGERPLLVMKIGKPITLPAIIGRGEMRRISRQHNVDLIMEEIADLLPEEYRGEYSAVND